MLLQWITNHDISLFIIEVIIHRVSFQVGGLCLGVSVWGHLCPGGVSVRETPYMVTSGQCASFVSIFATDAVFPLIFSFIIFPRTPKNDFVANPRTQLTLHQSVFLQAVQIIEWTCSLPKSNDLGHYLHIDLFLNKIYFTSRVLVNGCGNQQHHSNQASK